jgi:hypothetical protein
VLETPRNTFLIVKKSDGLATCENDSSLGPRVTPTIFNARVLLFSKAYGEGKPVGPDFQGSCVTHASATLIGHSGSWRTGSLFALSW